MQPCRCIRGGKLEAAPPFDTLRELRLWKCEVKQEDTAALAAVARRLRVLHLES
jgi:hypothetical protein